MYEHHHLRSLFVKCYVISFLSRQMQLSTSVLTRNPITKSIPYIRLTVRQQVAVSHEL